jgi:hypothetical protein
MRTFPLFPTLWNGAFQMPEVLRKLFPEPPAPKSENESRTGEKRRKRRQKFQVEVLAYPLRPKPSHIPLRGDLKNLSKNGACVQFLKAVEESHLYLLDFQLPEEQSVQLPGKVVWCRNRLCGFELLSADDAKKILKESK